MCQILTKGYIYFFVSYIKFNFILYAKSYQLNIEIPYKNRTQKQIS